MNEYWPHTIRSNWSEEYPRYLRSPEWKQKRKQVMDACGSRCACGAVAKEVHHKSYDSVGDEDLDHLEAVCSECHIAIHQLQGKERRKPPTTISTAGFKRMRKQKPTKRKRGRRRRMVKSNKIIRGAMHKKKRNKKRGDKL